jgi:hypothetical protein
MNKLRLSIAMLMLVGLAQAQSVTEAPVFTKLTWEEVAGSLNTLDKKGLPMTFVGGITLDCGEALEAPYPIPVSLMVEGFTDLRALQLLRWDGSLRKWMRFTGSGIHRELGDVDGAVSFTLRKEGTYALFTSDHPTGQVEITLPKNHACSSYRFTQHNVKVVAEGKGRGQTVLIPVASPSPRAKLVLECLDENGTAYTLSAPFGAICETSARQYLDQLFSYQINRKELAAIAQNK